MVSINPAKFLRGQAEIKRAEEEAIALLRQNIASRYHSKNIAIKRAERIRFTSELSARKVDAKSFMNLALEAGKSVKIFTQWEEKNITNQGVTYLSELKPGTVFSTVMCIIRDFYAHDIAEYIPRRAATIITIDEILFRP